MNRRQAGIAALEARLAYTFTDRALLEQALTHASVGDPTGKSPDNERLEFLGDRVLGLIIAERLMAHDEAADAGVLSKRFHVWVSGEACARAARTLGLGAALRLPGGESRRGARDHDKILADACEALIGALFLERGLAATANTVLDLWTPMLDAPLDLTSANPKSALQEWAAAEGQAAPAYRVVAREGPDHEPAFTVEVSIGGGASAIATARSVRAAEKSAALALLQRQRKDA